MNRESVEYGQVIVLDDKYYSYGSGTLERAWSDKSMNAILWNNRLNDLTKIYVPDNMKEDMKKAKLIPVKKIITFEFLNNKKK